ncbi:MAG: FtsX-like permease family protein [Acidobacteria bacterium]|nr:MAG: FtsX-like permease family protein [Acidobacteriota bacterium]
MNALLQELRQALRSFARRPGSSLVVVATLGLGIGAATSVLALINLLDWRRPPVARPAELVLIHTGSIHGFIGPYGPTSYPDFLDYREASRSFAGLAAITTESLTLDTGETTVPAAAWMVSGNAFELLGVPAAAGRVLVPEDDRAGAPPVVVLAHDVWRRHFGGEPGVVGSIVRLAGQPFTVAGVAAAGFAGTTAGERVAVFLPLEQRSRVLDAATNSLADRQRPSLALIGRLRPGVSAGQARAELQAIAGRLDREHPLAGIERRLSVSPMTLAHPIDRRNFRPTLRLLVAAVILLLLISCANVANLLLARATARQREMALRCSLGAPRWRLLRQLLAESLLLAFAGGLCGLLLAAWARDVLALFTGPDFAREMHLDPRVLGLTAALCALVTVLFGLVPALAAARVDLVTALKDGVAGDRRRRLPAGQLLVVAQVALAVVLLCATGVLARGLWQLRAADLGFATGGLLTARVDLEQGRYDRPRGEDLFRRLKERLAARPGVQEVGLALFVPPVYIDVEARFRLPESPEAIRSSRVNFVDRGFFETLGIQLLQGRLFEPRDGASEEGLVIVNRVLAEELWPGESPLGRRLLVERRRPWEPGPEYRVIGVVESITQHATSLGPEPVLYFAGAQRYRPSRALVIRAGGDPQPIFDGLRRALRELDPSLTLVYAQTLREQRWESLVVQRLQAQAVGIFGLLGLLLALLGVFAVLSYTISRQTREIGIRMALGARRGDVLRWVVGRGSLLALGGLGAGFAGSIAAIPLLRSVIVGLGAFDPAIFAAVALLILAAAAVAAYLPARRAAAVEPIRALRHD